MFSDGCGVADLTLQYLQDWKGRSWVALGRGAVIVRNEGALKSAAQGS
jgi:hypothetical protein